MSDTGQDGISAPSGPITPGGGAASSLFMFSMPIKAKESIDKLLPAAKEIGTQLCIENLPRIYLGRTSSEIWFLIQDYPEVIVCFDSNHLLIEDHNLFFQNVGHRIGTIHTSDYDKVDERHWMPGLGVIDWPLFLLNLSISDMKVSS